MGAEQRELSWDETIKPVADALGITERSPIENWRDALNPKNLHAIETLGLDIREALETFTGAQEEWRETQGRRIGDVEIIRGWYYIQAVALERASKRVEEVTETIRKTGDNILNRALHEAELGNLQTVEALLEGMEPTDATHAIKAIALLAKAVPFDERLRKRFDYHQQVGDLFDAAGVHLARLIVRDMRSEIPDFLEKASKL